MNYGIKHKLFVGVNSLILNNVIVMKLVSIVNQEIQIIVNLVRIIILCKWIHLNVNRLVCIIDGEIQKIEHVNYVMMIVVIVKMMIPRIV